MKKTIPAITAALLAAACAPTTKTPAAKTAAAAAATGFVDAKQFDLSCTGDRKINGEATKANLVLHIDLKRMTWSRDDEPKLSLISSINNAMLVLTDSSDDSSGAVVNRGDGTLNVWDNGTHLSIEGKCEPKAYVELARKF